jgi:glycosyltransferase involved in cell wall biosynthesis
MKLSVAMCTYNGARYVREQLESIATQTRPPDELVVCDDHSTDETPDIVAGFARTSSFPVRLHINEKNLGSTSNFAHALSICNADFIAFSDQDDVWLSDKLARLEKSLHDGAGLAFTNGALVDRSLIPLGPTVWQTLRFGEREQRLFHEGHAFDVLLDHNVATGAAMAFRTEYRDLIVPIPVGLTHDGVPVLHDWWAALLIAAVGKIVFIPEPLFKYRQHEHQQLGSSSTIEDDERKARRPSLRAAATRPNVFQPEIEYLRAVLDRLVTRSEFGARTSILEQLRDRIAHLNARARLPKARPFRIAPVVRELVKRRYHRYSNGFYSASKDLWLRHDAVTAPSETQAT